MCEVQRYVTDVCMHNHEKKKNKLDFLALAIEIFPGHAFFVKKASLNMRSMYAGARYIDFLKEKYGVSDGCNL